MLLDVSRAMRDPGEAIAFQHRDDIPPQDVLGDTVTFTDVLLTGHFSAEDDRLRLWGTLTCTAHGHCAGCLAPVELPMEVPFDEIFIRKTRYTVQDEDSDWEERWMYEGSKVELSHLSMTLAVLALPIRMECGGGCPVLSGLPSGDSILSHACQKDMPDQHPFSALQQLLTKDQEV